MEYNPGDTVRVIHTETGMQFPESIVSVDKLGRHEIYLMAQHWYVESDKVFKSLYPRFHLELVRKT